MDLFGSKKKNKKETGLEAGFRQRRSDLNETIKEQKNDRIGQTFSNYLKTERRQLDQLGYKPGEANLAGKSKAERESAANAGVLYELNKNVLAGDYALGYQNRFRIDLKKFNQTTLEICFTDKIEGFDPENCFVDKESISEDYKKIADIYKEYQQNVAEKNLTNASTLKKYIEKPELKQNCMASLTLLLGEDRPNAAFDEKLNGLIKTHPKLVRFIVQNAMVKEMDNAVIEKMKENGPDAINSEEYAKLHNINKVTGALLTRSLKNKTQIQTDAKAEGGPDYKQEDLDEVEQTLSDWRQKISDYFQKDTIKPEKIPETFQYYLQYERSISEVTSKYKNQVEMASINNLSQIEEVYAKFKNKSTLAFSGNFLVKDPTKVDDETMHNYMKNRRTLFAYLDGNLQENPVEIDKFIDEMGLTFESADEEEYTKKKKEHYEKIRKNLRQKHFEIYNMVLYRDILKTIQAEKDGISNDNINEEAVESLDEKLGKLDALLKIVKEDDDLKEELQGIEGAKPKAKEKKTEEKKTEEKKLGEKKTEEKKAEEKKTEEKKAKETKDEAKKPKSEKKVEKPERKEKKETKELDKVEKAKVNPKSVAEALGNQNVKNYHDEFYEGYLQLVDVYKAEEDKCYETKSGSYERTQAVENLKQNRDVILSFNSNDIAELNKLKDAYPTNKALANHVDERIKNLEIIDREAKKNHQSKFMNIAGSFSINGIDQFKEKRQNSANGCWSCALSLLLYSRGVNLDQKVIRSYRGDVRPELDTSPETMKANSSIAQNTDRPNSISDHMNLVTRVLPNTAMKKVCFNYDAARQHCIDNSAPIDSQNKKQQWQNLSPEINNKLTEVKASKVEKLRKYIETAFHNKSALTILIGEGHYITVCGGDADLKNLKIYDSAKHDTSCLINQSFDNLANEVKKFDKAEFLWLEDIKSDDENLAYMDRGKAFMENEIEGAEIKQLVEYDCLKEDQLPDWAKELTNVPEKKDAHSLDGLKNSIIGEEQVIRYKDGKLVNIVQDSEGMNYNRKEYSSFVVSRSENRAYDETVYLPKELVISQHK